MLIRYLVGYPMFGKPDIWYSASRISGIRPVGYPANETRYPARYRIPKKAGYPAGRISGTTLYLPIYHRIIKRSIYGSINLSIYLFITIYLTRNFLSVRFCYFPTKNISTYTHFYLPTYLSRMVPRTLTLGGTRSCSSASSL